MKNIARFISRFLILLVLCLSLSGCGNMGKWWIGKWTLDQAATQQHLQANTQNQGIGGLLSGFLGGMAAGALDGMTMDIKGKEMLVTQQGNGRAVKYEVISRDGNKSVTIKQADGEITTWLHEGEHLVLTTSNSSVKLYMKRVK